MNNNTSILEQTASDMESNRINHKVNWLFSDHRYLLYNSLKDYVEDCFNCNAGLKELWTDLIRQYKTKEDLDDMGIECIFDEKFSREMRHAEWNIDVALFGYYALHSRRVRTYPLISEKNKIRMANQIFREVKKLSAISVCEKSKAFQAPENP